MAALFFTTDEGSLRRTRVPLIMSGVLMLVFGIVVLTLPRLTAGVLVVLVGVASVIAGLTWLSWAISLARSTGGWWPLSLLPGAVLVAFGAFALVRPTSLAEFLFRAAGTIAAVWGLADMVASWRLRPFFQVWWLRLVRGLLATAAGVAVVLVPAAGIVTAGILIGAWFILVGAITIALGIAAWRLPRAGSAAPGGASTGPGGRPLPTA